MAGWRSTRSTPTSPRPASGIALDGDQAYVIADTLELDRFTPPDASSVETIATLLPGPTHDWWDNVRDYRGWIGLDDARLFFWQAEADRTFELCSVPKLGGAQACSAPIASIGPFTVTSSAAYAHVDGRFVRVDKTTGAGDVFWDAGDWRVTGNVWAVTGGVEWLTSDGDLYRFDEPACWRK